MADLSENITNLDAAYPIALLPVRIETRFVSDIAPELLVRVYPDEIVAELGHLLTSDAAAAARTFWRDGWAFADELDAWRRLVARYPSHVAAALIELDPPDNLATRPAGVPTWAAPPPAPSPETALARVLPDAWIVVGHRSGAEVLRFVGGPIVEPLALAFRSDLADDAPEIVEHDGLRVEEALRWTVDFEAAIAAGMGMRVPITSGDLAQGFDRLTVYGVKTTLTAAASAERLEGLFASHRGTRGLALVPQGTPTNNSGEGTAGYPPSEDAERSFAIERGTSLVTEGSDGMALAAALGLPATVFAHVEGAGGQEQRRARAMNQALWPCTMGYFLEQMMTPLVSAATIADARAHFADFVRGRGPLPAFRVGRVPYGVMPVTPLWGSVDSFESALVQRLTSWQPLVLARTVDVARVGRTGDPDADLLGALHLDASTREVRLREVIGPAYVRALLALVSASVPDASFGERAALTSSLMTTLGIDGKGAPRVGQMTFSDQAPRIQLPLVTPGPLSEVDPLADDYITDLLTARTTADLDPSPVSRPLLFHLLRQGALVEYHRVAVELAITAGRSFADASDRREIELVHIPPPAPNLPPRLTPTQRFAQVLPVTDGTQLGQWLLDLPRRSGAGQRPPADPGPRRSAASAGGRAHRGAGTPVDRDAGHLFAPSGRLEHLPGDPAAGGASRHPADRRVHRRLCLRREPARASGAERRSGRRVRARAELRPRGHRSDPAQWLPDLRPQPRRRDRPVVATSAARAIPSGWGAPRPAGRCGARVLVRASAPRSPARSLPGAVSPAVSAGTNAEHACRGRLRADRGPQRGQRSGAA
jgi:hypothetical protein